MEYIGKLYGKVGKGYFPLQMTAEEVDELVKFKESVIKEITRRQDLIKSEPNGIVRETMIDNLLNDL